MIRFFFFLICSLWLASPARAEASAYRLTKTDLAKQIGQVLATEGIAETARVTIVGTLPEVVYESPVAFSPKITLAENNGQAQNFKVEVQLVADGTPSQLLGQPFMVNGRYDALHKIPVLTHRLNSRETIGPADIAWLEVPTRRIDRDTVVTEEELLGKSPRQTLSANRPIRAHELMAPQVVQKNDQVNVIYRVGRLEVKVTGIAMQNGAVGDVISARNSDSRNLITARVVAPGKLEVAQNMQLSQKQ